MIDRKQVIATTVDASGNTTELWTNTNGGGTKLSAVNDNVRTFMRAA